MVLRYLEELAHQEERAEQARIHEEADGVGGRERHPLEQAQGDHRRAGLPFPDNERCDEHGTARDAPDHLATGPTHGVGADQAISNAQESRRREHQADDVEPWPRTEALVEADGAQQGHENSYWHVDPEDPVPVEPVDNGSSENRSPGDG